MPCSLPTSPVAWLTLLASVATVAACGVNVKNDGSTATSQNGSGSGSGGAPASGSGSSAPSGSDGQTAGGATATTPPAENDSSQTAGQWPDGFLAALQGLDDGKPARFLIAGEPGLGLDQPLPVVTFTRKTPTKVTVKGTTTGRTADYTLDTAQDAALGRVVRLHSQKGANGVGSCEIYGFSAAGRLVRAVTSLDGPSGDCDRLAPSNGSIFTWKDGLIASARDDVYPIEVLHDRLGDSDASCTVIKHEPSDPNAINARLSLALNAQAAEGVYRPATFPSYAGKGGAFALRAIEAATPDLGNHPLVDAKFAFGGGAFSEGVFQAMGCFVGIPGDSNSNFGTPMTATTRSCAPADGGKNRCTIAYAASGSGATMTLDVTFRLVEAREAGGDELLPAIYSYRRETQSGGRTTFSTAFTCEYNGSYQVTRCDLTTSVGSTPHSSWQVTYDSDGVSPVHVEATGGGDVPGIVLSTIATSLSGEDGVTIDVNY